jgi:hypothetical protein
MNRAVGLVRSRKFAISDIITHRVPLSSAVHAYDIFDKKLDGCVKLIFDLAAPVQPAEAAAAVVTLDGNAAAGGEAPSQPPCLCCDGGAAAPVVTEGTQLCVRHAACL